MSTRVWESSFIPASINSVWTILRRLDWGWSPKVQCVRTVPADSKEAGVQPPLSGAMGVGDERLIVYRDETKQRIRLMALSDQDRSLSWSVVDSTPALTYSGVSHTVSLKRVTSVAAGGEGTYIEWDGMCSTVLDLLYCAVGRNGMQSCCLPVADGRSVWCVDVCWWCADVISGTGRHNQLIFRKMHRMKCWPISD